MACGAKGVCKSSYRKGGSNAVHCQIQTNSGGKWDFCKHQYLCGKSNRFELSEEASTCNLPYEYERPKEVKTPAQKKTKEKKVVKENGD